MTPARAQRMRELCAAATPGPWEHHPDSDCVNVGDVVYAERGYLTLANCDCPATAAFIAESRSLLPDLLAECERLRALVAEMENERDMWRSQHKFVCAREYEIAQNLERADRTNEKLRSLLAEACGLASATVLPRATGQECAEFYERLDAIRKEAGIDAV